MEKLRIEREIAMLRYATQQQVALDKAKTDLARTTMELSVTRELAQLKTEPGAEDTPTVTPPATPPIEPAGRADEGRSYEQ